MRNPFVGGYGLGNRLMIGFAVGSPSLVSP